MQELTQAQIHEIKELQNEMAIEGHNIPWDRCVEAYLEAEAEESEEKLAKETLEVR